MELHHSKHHQTYVNGLNAAEDGMKQAVENRDVKKAIELQAAMKFNGGGAQGQASLQTVTLI
jgi:Fe-Mn family superoxide dismutase